jgi:hypothetical protein
MFDITASLAYRLNFALINVDPAMKTSMYFIISLLISTAVGKNSDTKNKLQIGIKRRVNYCILKSKKGDILFVNYVVGLDKFVPFDV